jgi:hypothetical protein
MHVYILFVLAIAGTVLMLNGVVGLCVRNKTGPWKEGGASLLAGAIVVGVPLGILLASVFSWLPD